jgi:hypothetical protein
VRQICASSNRLIGCCVSSTRSSCRIVRVTFDRIPLFMPQGNDRIDE